MDVVVAGAELQNLNKCSANARKRRGSSSIAGAIFIEAIMLATYGSGPGTKLGPYEIIAPLGAGGMGEVYRARDGRLTREVAIKVLSPAFSTDADRLHRFGSEARAAGLLNHANILSIYDIGVVDSSPFVVSELLEGATLREKLRDGGLSPRKAAEFAIQISRGLGAAHGKGIVHRDLKPVLERVATADWLPNGQDMLVGPRSRRTSAGGVSRWQSDLRQHGLDLFSARISRRHHGRSGCSSSVLE
jgi:serine/threonine protein kinase